MRRTKAEERTERERLEEIARGNVERHLDVCEGEDGADSIYDEAYTLAHDALVDAGTDARLASEVARYVAMCYAQP